METKKMSSLINNDIYDHLGERWYTAKDDPVALLRAESNCRNPWIIEVLRSHFNGQSIHVLDVGCGGGFLSNALALEGHRVTGIDCSVQSLHVARRYDSTKSVRYETADVYSLPYSDAQFDAVCAMDFLEHIEDPQLAIQAMGRVLKPNGLFFFHTFNRNPLSTLLVIKLVEWLVKNTPPQMHISRLFIKPKELERYCLQAQMQTVEMRGLKPVLLSRAFLKGLFTGLVEEGFSFKFGKSLLLSYCGYAKKQI